MSRYCVNILLFFIAYTIIYGILYGDKHIFRNNKVMTYDFDDNYYYESDADDEYNTNYLTNGYYTYDIAAIGKQRDEKIIKSEYPNSESNKTITLY